MQVFGCRAYVLTSREQRSKWDPKACEGLFMEYEDLSKAYCVFGIDAGQVVISRDVTFDESTFGYSLALPQEFAEDFALCFDAMDINDGPGNMQYKKTGKLKSRSNSQDQVHQRSTTNCWKMRVDRMTRHHVKPNDDQGITSSQTTTKCSSQFRRRTEMQ